MATPAQAATAAAAAAADADGGVGSPCWFDRIVTPLNACSLETYAPIPMRTMRRRPSSAPNDDNDDDDDAIDNKNIPLAVPLVIGCYQLDETSDPKPAEDGDGKESEEEGDDDHDRAAAAAAAVDVDVEKSSRSGELRLYMIPEFSSSSSSSSVGRAIGGEGGGVGPMFENSAAPVPCRRVAKMMSGVLDGKWRRQTRRTSRGGDARDSSGSGNGAPLFACACASGRIHLHSLEYDFEEEEDVDDDDDDEKKKKKERSSSSSSWGLSRVASSDGPPPSGSSSSSSPPLCLSLAWDDFLDDNDGNHHHHHHCRLDSNDKSHRSIDRIVSSYSDGSVALHDVVRVYARSEKNSDAEGKKWTTTTAATTSIEERHRWNAHAMFGCPSEVWTCSFLRGDENVVMSGADDCKLKIWDVRQTLRPTHAIGDTEFGAGVTAISPHPSICHVFAVGSYDEVVRVYDARKMDVPVSRVEVGGGVWRIKWHPSCYWNSENYDKDEDGVVDDGVETTTAGCCGTILVAAMHGGCRVVDFPSLTMGAAGSSSGKDYGADEKYDDDDVAVVSGGSTEILSKFTAHESMAYGADWVWFGRRQSKGDCKDAAAASCSFYDRQAFLWDPYGHQ